MGSTHGPQPRRLAFAESGSAGEASRCCRRESRQTNSATARPLPTRVSLVRRCESVEPRCLGGLPSAPRPSGPMQRARLRSLAHCARPPSPRLPLAAPRQWIREARNPDDGVAHEPSDGHIAPVGDTPALVFPPRVPPGIGFWHRLDSPLLGGLIHPGPHRRPSPAACRPVKQRDTERGQGSREYRATER